MLLTDTLILENVSVIEESSSKGTMVIEGVFQRADEPNNNKRLYSEGLLNREITRLEESLGNRRLMGELDHPSHDSVKLSNVSHVVTQLEMRGKEMVGRAELLSTPAGLTAQALVKGGVGVGISSRGTGTLSDSDDGVKIVNEDYKLLTFDLVAAPSTRGAWPSLKESTENSERSKAIVESTMRKATSEKIFLTLLRNKLTK